MTIPDAPLLPEPHPAVTIPSYFTAEEVVAFGNSWLSRDKALRAEIDRLVAQQPTPTPTPTPSTKRFPGDPGPGKAIFGVAPGGDNRVKLQELERAVGGKLAFRQYHGGSDDMAVPNGVLAKAIIEDHKAGRIPVISPKPGHERLAAHDPAFRTVALKFYKWLDEQPGITILIIHHEGENDWPNDFYNLVAYAKHQADYRAAQRWNRELLNEATGGKPKKIIFIGSLMSYPWSAEGRKKFGDPEGWNPGKQADGTHVWDIACLDHYLPSYTGTTLENAQWLAATKSVKAWGVPLGITENGVNWGNKNGGTVLAAFIKRFVEAYGGVVYLYFSSNAGAGGKPQSDQNDWWILTDGNGSLGAYKEAYKKYAVNPNA